MRQLDNVVKVMARLLGIFIAFGILSAQAQAEGLNSMAALSVNSTGGGATIIKV